MPDQGLPPGITLDSQPHDAAPNTSVAVNQNPALPPGVTLDAQPHDFDPAAQTQQQKAIQQSQSDLTSTPKDLAVGFGKGALKTAVGVGELVNKGAGNQGMEETLAKGRELAEPKNLGEGAGNVMEEMTEWAAGEEGLKGLASISKVATRAPEIMQILEDYPRASQAILKMLEKTPKIVKAGAEAAAKGAVIGGTQGGVKGAADGDATGGAESGAAGGAIAGVISELGIKPTAEGIGKLFGIGRDSLEEASRAAQVGKRNERFRTDWPRALPELAKEYPSIKGEGQQGVTDAAHKQANTIWNGPIHNMAEPHLKDLKNMQPVADAIDKIITPSMTEYSPENAKAAESLRNKFTGQGSKSMMSLGQIESDIGQLNAELSIKKWWQKTAEERAAEIKAGTPEGVKSELADALRDVYLDHIDSFGDNNIRELRKTYGALRNIEHEFRGQINVQNRKAYFSLKKSLAAGSAVVAAAAGGGATHGPLGAALGAGAAIIPTAVDALVNSPDAMAERAVKLGMPDTPVEKFAKSAAKKATSAASGVTGERVAEKAENAGEDKWVRIVGSDGQHYEVHPQDLNKALAADKGAKIVVPGRE